MKHIYLQICVYRKKERKEKRKRNSLNVINCASTRQSGNDKYTEDAGWFLTDVAEGEIMTAFPNKLEPQQSCCLDRSQQC